MSVLQSNQAGIEHIVSFDTLDGAAQLASLGHCEKTVACYTIFASAASLDIAWSEENENILASCSGDGTIKIWDLIAPQNPIRSIPAHGKEVSSLDWNSNNTGVFLSSSWDDTVKLWNFANCSCIRTFDRHTYCVYSAKWYAVHGLQCLRLNVESLASHAWAL